MSIEMVPGSKPFVQLQVQCDEWSEILGVEVSGTTGVMVYLPLERAWRVRLLALDGDQHVHIGNVYINERGWLVGGIPIAQGRARWRARNGAADAKASPVRFSGAPFQQPAQPLEARDGVGLSASAGVDPHVLHLVEDAALFRTLPDRVLDESGGVIEVVGERRILIERDTRDDWFYFVMQGHVEIYQDDPGQPGVEPVAIRGAGETVGELQVARPWKRRNAWVVAGPGTRLWKVAGVTVRRWIREQPAFAAALEEIATARTVDAFLAEADAFARPLGPAERAAVMAGMEVSRPLSAAEAVVRRPEHRCEVFLVARGGLIEGQRHYEPGSIFCLDDAGRPEVPEREAFAMERTTVIRMTNLPADLLP